MSSQKTGISTALEGTHTAPADAEQKQGELLPSEKPQKDVISGQESSNSVEPRGRGRPAGAKNKRTQKMIDLLTARHGSTPLEECVRLGMMDIKSFAKALGVKKATVKSLSFDQIMTLVEKKIKFLSASLPYCHQKLPVEVNMETEGRVQFILGDFGQGQLPNAEDDPCSVVLADIAYDVIDKPVEGAEKENA